jgi:hypothetical protein
MILAFHPQTLFKVMSDARIVYVVVSLIAFNAVIPAAHHDESDSSIL